MVKELPRRLIEEEDTVGISGRRRKQQPMAATEEGSTSQTSLHDRRAHGLTIRYSLHQLLTDDSCLVPPMRRTGG